MKRYVLFLAMLLLVFVASFAASPKHEGWTRLIDGGKLVEGHTSWLGAYHYTRARLGKYDDSGRCYDWGFSGASAFSSEIGALFAVGKTNYGK